MIYKYILPFAFLLLISCNATKRSQVSSSGSLLWKIEKSGIDKPSYIYGTIHIMPESMFFMGDDLTNALSNAEALVLEADIDMSIKEQLALASKVMLPQGKTYHDYMSEKDYNALHDYLIHDIGIKEGKVERYFKLKPFNLTSLVLMEHYEGVKIYEKELSSLAKKADIDILELESVDYQLNLFDSLGLSMDFPTAEDLLFIEEFEKLLDAYLSKDLNQIEKAMESQIDLTKEEDLVLVEHLLKARNHNWIPKIEKMISEQSVLIAVGVGHLYGEEGVLKLLIEQGYKVTSVE